MKSTRNLMRKSIYWHQNPNSMIDYVEEDDNLNMKNFKNKKIKLNDENIENQRLNRDFFQRYSTIELALNLLGTVICRRFDDTICRGLIVETEAYLGVEDEASYSFGGRRTESNEPMFMEPGTCFVRLIYGMYFCFNLSSNDYGGAILIRAIEPVEGIDKMIEMRTNHPKAPRTNKFLQQQHLIANGPSKFCIAFAINEQLNKLDITKSEDIWIESNASSKSIDIKNDVIESKRIGINSKNPWANKLLRFYLKDNKSVSKL
uniref:DNA-3-methyladenine glycosylase n=1 Tax=Sarcoptes scabiei TaxID=52283 RepID=A0A834R7T9_SARSC